MSRLFLFFGVVALLSYGCRKPVETDNPDNGSDTGDKETEAGPLSAGTPSDSENTAEETDGTEVVRVESDQLEISDDGILAHHNGKLFSGIATSHYPNGELATEISYVEGMRDGVETRWHENGIKRFEGRFHKNQLVGVFEEWYPTGKKRSEVLWQDGKRVSIREWGENGEILREN